MLLTVYLCSIFELATTDLQTLLLWGICRLTATIYSHMYVCVMTNTDIVFETHNARQNALMLLLYRSLAYLSPQAVQLSEFASCLNLMK